MAEYGESLSDREREILCLVATGVTNREIAYRLDISVNTVKVHLRNIFAKLGAESRTEATMIAVQQGWMQVGGEGQVPGAQGVVEDETAITQLQPPSGTLHVSLPRHKRIALLVAPLLAAAAMALTWPTDSSQPRPAPDLPLDQPRGQPAETGLEPEESPWRERAQMPTRRAYLALTSIEGRVFAIAGQTPEGVTGAVEIYDPAENIWGRGTAKPTPVTYVSGAAIETDVYVPGGCDGTGTPMRMVEVYDTVADTWREVSPLPEPRCAHALAPMGGKLYLFGGWNGDEYVATTYVYDPQADVWTEETPMPTKRGFAAAAPLDDRLYVVGGYDDEMELSSCTMYDPQTKSWRECAPLTVGRGGVGLVSLSGYLYAIGGGGWTSYLGFNERYNPANDAWGAIETPLVEEWRSPGVVAVDNTIYAIGGWSGGCLSSNQAYDPLPFRIFIPVSQR
jgi:DNA-binding CsgD family transcriptional regulator